MRMKSYSFLFPFVYHVLSGYLYISSKEGFGERCNQIHAHLLSRLLCFIVRVHYISTGRAPPNVHDLEVHFPLCCFSSHQIRVVFMKGRILRSLSTILLTLSICFQSAVSELQPCLFTHMLSVEELDNYGHIAYKVLYVGHILLVSPSILHWTLHIKTLVLNFKFYFKIFIQCCSVWGLFPTLTS